MGPENLGSFPLNGFSGPLKVAPMDFKRNDVGWNPVESKMTMFSKNVACSAWNLKKKHNSSQIDDIYDYIYSFKYLPSWILFVLRVSFFWSAQWQGGWCSHIHIIVHWYNSLQSVRLSKGYKVKVTGNRCFLRQKNHKRRYDWCLKSTTPWAVLSLPQKSLGLIFQANFVH